jgi:hypothetical protein
MAAMLIQIFVVYSLWPLIIFSAVAEIEFTNTLEVILLSLLFIFMSYLPPMLTLDYFLFLSHEKKHGFANDFVQGHLGKKCLMLVACHTEI